MAETMESVVTYGVKVFKRAEVGAVDLMTDIDKLHKAFDGALSTGMCGTLAHLRISADIDTAKGKVAEALGILARLHREGTDMALANGVDQVGDGGGGVVILGGPGR